MKRVGCENSFFLSRQFISSFYELCVVDVNFYSLYAILQIHFIYIYVCVAICTYSNPDLCSKLKVELCLSGFGFLFGWFWFVFWVVSWFFIVVKVDK